MKRTLLAVAMFCTSLVAQDLEMQRAVREGKASLLVINTTPAGASIVVDGQVLAPSPVFPINHTPSLFFLMKKSTPRVISLLLDGYKPVERRLDPNGSPLAIEAKFEPITAPDPPPVPVPTPVPAPPVSEHMTASVAAKPSPISIPSPFGFRYGSSKADVIRQLGASAVVKNTGNEVVFNTAPSPHAEFERYIAFFSPQKGLLKVVAFSQDIKTSDDGSDLKSAFDRFRSGLENKYGPSKLLDNCKGGQAECEPQFYMMELMKKNRQLFALWPNTTAPSPQETGIVIEGNAIRLDRGFITITYEFPGWDDFVEQQDSKKNSVF